jgi:hypothetical protein
MGARVPAWGEPAESVLIELGRLTWIAINLEGSIGAVTRQLDRRQWNARELPVGVAIDNAVRALRGMEPGPAPIVNALDWLVEAKSALELRNQVLHAVPGTLVTVDGGQVTWGDDVLRHMRSGAELPLSVEDLRSVSQRIAEVNERWTSVAVDLFTHLEGERQHPRSP